MADLSDYTTLLGQTLRDLGPSGDLVREQTIGANIDNRTKALQLQYLQQLPGALASSSGAGASSGASGGGSSLPSSADPEDWAHIQPGIDADSDQGVNGVALTQHLQARYAPVPGKVYTPQEWNAMNAATLAGKPEMAKTIADLHQMQVDAANQQRSNGAQQNYNSLFGVLTAPDGRALDALSLVDADAAEQMRAQGATDADVRHFSAQMAGALHTAARLPVEYRKEDGVAVDAATKQPVPGYNLAVGLGPEQLSALKKEATKLTVMKGADGRDLQVPTWKAEGSDSADAWVQQHAQVGYQLRHGGQPSEQANRASPPWIQNAGAGASVSPQSAPPVQPRPQGPMQSNQAPPTSTPADPALKQALSDADYRLKLPVPPRGGSLLPDEQKERDAVVESRNTLLKDSGEATQAAAQSMTYLKAAKAIMDNKGATVGAYGGMVSQASRWIPFTGDVDATNYQEVAKYLGNAALAAAKGNYGAKMTQSEVGLQLNELSPSVHMSDKAINDLLAENIRNSQYAIDSAKRVKPFLTVGNDPRTFRDWNEQHFPQNKAVNDNGSSTPSTEAPSAALSALKSNPQLAPQFKAKYGYLPSGS